MKSMKKLLKGETSSPILDCMDNQFQAALSMEARSRSPLPPSPATFTTTLDIDSSISNLTQISLQDSSTSDMFNAMMRPKPSKPPRKNLVKVDKTRSPENASKDYEPIDKYDEIEYRNDAWKTLGVDDVKHTEKFVETVDMKTPPKKDQHHPVPLPKAPTIIKSVASNDLMGTSYDCLEFFGSSTKLNKAGYTQIASVTNNPSAPPQTHHYDEVQPVMEGIRSADDSHLDYASIRKVNHQFHNEEPYAVISKPKQV